MLFKTLKVIFNKTITTDKTYFQCLKSQRLHLHTAGGNSALVLDLPSPGS